MRILMKDQDQDMNQDEAFRLQTFRRLFLPDGCENIPKDSPYNLEYTLPENWEHRSLNEMQYQDFAGGFEKPMLFPSNQRRMRNNLDTVGNPFRIEVEFNDIISDLGKNRRIPVIEVPFQATKSTPFTLAQWKRYINQPKDQRAEILNVISIEFSGTLLSHRIFSPFCVRELDFVQFWPKDLQITQCCLKRPSVCPQVQKYLLLGASGAFTDFHIDLGGSSVWYHIVTGRKLFLLIPPLPKYLDMFQEWMSTSNDGFPEFFSHRVSDLNDIYIVSVETGDTILLPSGWIHAVYTAEDSVAIGGNFLHIFAVDTQIRIAEMEELIGIEYESRYPFFNELYWCVAKHFASLSEECLVKLSVLEQSRLHRLAVYLIDSSKDLVGDIPISSTYKPKDESKKKLLIEFCKKLDKITDSSLGLSKLTQPSLCPETTTETLDFKLDLIIPTEQVAPVSAQENILDPYSRRAKRMCTSTCEFCHGTESGTRMRKQW